MDWEQGSFDSVEQVGFTGNEFDDIYGKNMQLWWPGDGEVPTDKRYFGLCELRLVTDGTMDQHVHVIDENGAPMHGVAVVQGWKDGPALPADAIPNGGDPRSYPNRGNMQFTDAYGVVKWTWGAGEGYDPSKTEGAHWYWIITGPGGDYTDVVYGFGWRWGTNHFHVEPKFQLFKALPTPTDLEGILADLFSDLSVAYATAAAALSGGE